jgi:CRISPR-associated endonuclease/helicase Cas3
MYHHGAGLPDVIKSDGQAVLYERLIKDKLKTHLEESKNNLDEAIKREIEFMLSDNDFISKTMKILEKLTKAKNRKMRYFHLGFSVRFLSSCLIDGDRTSSALYDKRIEVNIENATVKPDWALFLERLKNKISTFSKDGKINEIRNIVSERCAMYAERENGIYTLSAGTGSGKTYASLLYALTLAIRTNKERIFIIAPYTSILDQNAKDIRSVLAPFSKNGEIILEHHSNLDQSEKSEDSTEASETWNVPIIITTMVQFLETLFAYGTRKIRRMHRFANAVIIFDEIQTLPASCTYLFTWAVQYLAQNTNTSILLCTATQPGLDKLDSKYALSLPEDTEIIQDKLKHFEDMRRVDIIDKTKNEGWKLSEIADFIESIDEKNILVVVNTKSQVQKLFQYLSERHSDWRIVHLSANMCPAHRLKVIALLKDNLPKRAEKYVCISTRLIEAGVDLDFDSAIRFFAGLDSVIQTAGRCNRNGELRDSEGNLKKGKVYIVNNISDEEKISSLPDLIHGQYIMRCVLRDFYADKEKYGNNLLHPDIISNYFLYYYREMPKSLLKHEAYTGRSDTIIDLLSDNCASEAEYNLHALKRYGKNAKPLTSFRQSFESAWKEFEVIGQHTVSVIVPFEKGENIIAELYRLPSPHRCIELQQEAQQYSISLYQKSLNELIEEKVINKVPLKNKLEIYTLNEKHYSKIIGLTDEEQQMSLSYM